MHQFPISLFHLSQISFPGVFFWGLQTTSGCCGLHLENRVCAEAIRREKLVVLPLLRSTCDTVHCLGKRARFSSSFEAVSDEFALQTQKWCYIKFAIDGFSFFKVTDEENSLRIPKCSGQSLACWFLRLWSFWTAFTCSCSLSWTQ